MTVSTIEAGVIRIGDGVTTVFSFSFEGRLAADIKVSNIVGQALQPVVSGFTPALDVDGVGGTVTFSVAPANLQSFYIYRETELTQLVSVSSQNKYDPKVVEDVWDKLTLIAQDLTADVARSVKVAPGSSSDTLLAAIFAAEAATAADAVETAADVVSTAANVVAAEAAAAASAASAITSGALTADLDPIALPAGFTRYNGTTAGTFPAGISAADEGVLEVRRVDASNAVEMLSPRLLDRTLWRRVAAGVKQAWQELISVPLAGAAVGDLAYWNGTTWARLPVGAAGASITNIGGSPAYTGRWVYLAPVTASGKGFGVPALMSGIPSWATEIEIVIQAVVLDATAGAMQLFFGNAGGFTIGNGWRIIMETGASTLATTGGISAAFPLAASSPASLTSNGVVRMTRVDPTDAVNVWSVNVDMHYGNSQSDKVIGISGSMGASPLTQIKFERAAGLFTSGQFVLKYR